MQKARDGPFWCLQAVDAMNFRHFIIWNVVTTSFLPMFLIDISKDFSPAMIACDEDWSIGKPWMLSLTAESLDKEDREFGFAGGEGFLVSWVQWEWSWLETDGGKDQLQKVYCLIIFFRGWPTLAVHDTINTNTSKSRNSWRMIPSLNKTGFR